MNQKLKITDVIALGFMLFAFFLGAGNIIFPPLAGQLAGDHVIPTMVGFLITAVGLPLLGIIAIALVGGGWDKLTQDLPKKTATIIAVLFFIIIGPAFAAPRTGLVAYEMGIKPFLDVPSQTQLTLFSVLFFVVAMFFAWSQGRLLDVIGKVLTPVLFIGLAVLSVMVFLNPQGDILAAQASYIQQPFSTGFLDGYNTMDTFASLMFGTLIIEALRSKKITQKAAVTKYVIYAAFIAAAGLALVYISLFYLGATSNSIASGLDNGGAILSVYVQALFGTEGQLVLSTIVLLACLTTSIGLISACSDYFSSLTPISYKVWVVVIGSACALVANVGLTQLIALFVPVLFALYPVAIAIVFLTLVRSRLPNRALAYRSVVLISLLFALIDAAKAVNIDVSALNFLPLFDYGMAWMLPTLAAIMFMLIVPKKVDQGETELSNQADNNVEFEAL
ncbi:branched-chain amino acid transport system II carrier protein [Vibrio algicola]|uniref:Branched-chain amino acid transport system carrier protein n=1 Tax=Vibrio algicola TaxID=2662262 RepID=A0A5Q0TEK7_9VIBR|nr:branched-chain amino acid transport system II carrier protein [Vibrio algicola]